MHYYRLIQEAVKTHKQLIEYEEAGVVDKELEARASDIHNIFYTKAPSGFFEEYVSAVHVRTGKPVLLIDRAGVKEYLARLGVNWKAQDKAWSKIT